jgi:hypothetical protein
MQRFIIRTSWHIKLPPSPGGGTEEICMKPQVRGLIYRRITMVVVVVRTAVFVWETGRRDFDLNGRQHC